MTVEIATRTTNYIFLSRKSTMYGKSSVAVEGASS